MRNSRSGDPSTVPGAPRARASDAQRTAVLEALDAAFTDGRLSSFEHYERTRTATRAQFIDELRPLVADLRGTDADLGLGEPEPSEAEAGTQAQRPAKRRGVLIGGLVVVGLLSATVAIAAVSGGPDPEPAPPGPLHTLDGMTRMLDAAEDEFGGQEIDTLNVSGSNAGLMQEDPTEPGKRLIHSFRGDWEETNFDSRTASSTFQLADIDPEVVMSAIHHAPAELDMDVDSRTSHVFISADALGDPEYRITISEGDHGDLGTVVVGVDGEVREVDPPD